MTFKLCFEHFFLAKTWTDKVIKALFVLAWTKKDKAAWYEVFSMSMMQYDCTSSRWLLSVVYDLTMNYLFWRNWFMFDSKDLCCTNRRVTDVPAHSESVQSFLNLTVCFPASPPPQWPPPAWPACPAPVPPPCPPPTPWTAPALARAPCPRARRGARCRPAPPKPWRCPAEEKQPWSWREREGRRRDRNAGTRQNSHHSPQEKIRQGGRGRGTRSPFRAGEFLSAASGSLASEHLWSIKRENKNMSSSSSSSSFCQSVQPFNSHPECDPPH